MLLECNRFLETVWLREKSVNYIKKHPQAFYRALVTISSRTLDTTPPQLPLV